LVTDKSDDIFNTVVNACLYILTPAMVAFALLTMQKLKSGIYKKLLLLNIFGYSMLQIGKWIQLGGALAPVDNGGFLCLAGKFFEMNGLALHTTANTILAFYLKHVYEGAESFDKTKPHKRFLVLGISLFVVNLFACNWVPASSTMGVYKLTYCVTSNGDSSQLQPLFWMFLLNMSLQVGFMIRSHFTLLQLRKSALKPASHLESVLLFTARALCCTYCVSFLPFLWVSFQVSFLKFDLSAEYLNVLQTLTQMTVICQIFVFGYLKNTLDKYEHTDAVNSRQQKDESMVDKFMARIVTGESSPTRSSGASSLTPMAEV